MYKLSRLQLLKIIEKQNKHITRLIKENSSLKNDAYLDGMTVTLSRKHGINRLCKEMKKSVVMDTVLTVCFIDIDKLKLINDTFGHAEGDNLILDVVKTIKGNIRKKDSITRLGGDEFLIVFTEADLMTAQSILDRIIGKINEINNTRKKDYHIDISYGFAEFKPTNSTTIYELIRKADIEMYKHKMTKSSKVYQF